MLNVYLGWDAREARAYDVARDSICRHSSEAVIVRPLKASELYDQRLLWRPVERVGDQSIDHLSGAPQSTEFASARFLIPFIHRQGWVLFADCDIVCLGDIAELFALTDSRYAVMCVQHQNGHHAGVKMDGQEQTVYARKNWSSVVLWNTSHPAHYRLTLAMVNQYPGDLLHRFFWLRDNEIGALPPVWNVLVNVQPMPEKPRILHYTLGGPFLDGWAPAPHDDLWHEAAGK